VTRHAARSASAAALVALVLVAGCSTAPAGTATDPPSSTRTIPPSLPPEVAAMWAEKVDKPKQTVPAEDLCGLLSAVEITEAVGIEALEGRVTGPTKCWWQIGGTTDPQGRPNAGVAIQTPKSALWLGEPTVVDGHPVRHKGQGDICVLRVLLRQPVEDVDDLPVLEMTVVTQDDAEDRCAAAESLTRLALDRLPSA
jgi:hypothetical protein